MQEGNCINFVYKAIWEAGHFSSAVQLRTTLTD
jgi:hypothetical protein